MRADDAEGSYDESWDREAVYALRRHLDLSQDQMARRLGTRQQTISEWERGVYAPGGIASTLLSMVAERAEFRYDARASREGSHGQGP